MHPLSFISNFKTQHKALFKLGDKHELIREINIRLAGFGGNVPTDEFTDRTEKMIKQFQRDYMHVAETGIVDMTVIEAMDKFRDDYPIDKFFEQARCVCSTMSNLTEKPCDGFGFSKYSSQKQKESITEKYRQYEYPGIHRTTFWVLRAWQFYLTYFDDRNMRISHVSSGYRCWVNNNTQIKKRTTTNHMGKALDIALIYDGKGISKADLCDNAREVLIKYCGAFYRWHENNKNTISLEPGKRARIKDDLALALTWVHYDVRNFELSYLEDKYFVKSVTEVNGQSMLSLLRKIKEY